MKLDDIIKAFELGLSSQTEKLAALVDRLEVAERRKGDYKVANKLAKLLAGTTTIDFEAEPETPAAAPTESLDRLILAGEVRSQLDDLLLEQRSGAKLAANGLTQSNKVLFVGKPGNGKTAAAKAIAAVLAIPCEIVLPSQIIDSHLGASGQNIARQLNASDASPRMVFFDEFDTYGASRLAASIGVEKEQNSLVTNLTLQIDRLPPTVLLLAATNLREAIDPALLRRFDLKITFPEPDDAGRLELLRRLRESVPPLVDINDEDYLRISEGLSFAECEGVLLRAAKRGILRNTKATVELFAADQSPAAPNV